MNLWKLSQLAEDNEYKLFRKADKDKLDLLGTPFSGNYNDLTNKPTLFSGDYNDLINKPNVTTIGYTIEFNCINQATTTDSQTVYWGSKNLAQQTTADIHRIYIPKSGTIKACMIHLHSATAGTAENWSMYIRLNNTTDTLVGTLALNTAHRLWSKTDLNISVTAGNYIEIKEIQPAWVTNPANVRRSGIIYIE